PSMSSARPTPAPVCARSLHDALPILFPELVAGNQFLEVHALTLLVGDLDADGGLARDGGHDAYAQGLHAHGDVILEADDAADLEDRKSTRLNSSHGTISYAVFCLTKK